MQVLQCQPTDQANGRQAAQCLQPPAAVVGRFAAQRGVLLSRAAQIFRCGSLPRVCGQGLRRLRARMGQDLRRAGGAGACILRAGLAVELHQRIGPLGVLLRVHAGTSMAWRSLARA